MCLVGILINYFWFIINIKIPPKPQEVPIGDGFTKSANATFAPNEDASFALA